MWLFSGTPDDSQDDTVIEKDGAEALHYTVKSLMDAISAAAEEAQ